MPARPPHCTCPVMPFCLLALPLLSLAASKPDGTISAPPITVLVDFEKPHSDISLNAMRRRLGSIFAPTGIAVSVELKSELKPFSQFAELVVFKMKGSCTMSAKPTPIGALSDERGPLAMAYTSDGEILHFGEVECDRLRHSLVRTLGPGFSLGNEKALGQAMATVLAHEIYHMIGRAKEHTHKGVTKQSLSAEELLDHNLKLPDEALEAIDRGHP